MSDNPRSEAEEGQRRKRDDLIIVEDRRRVTEDLEARSCTPGVDGGGCLQTQPHSVSPRPHPGSPGQDLGGGRGQAAHQSMGKDGIVEEFAIRWFTSARDNICGLLSPAIDDRSIPGGKNVNFSAIFGILLEP